MRKPLLLSLLPAALLFTNTSFAQQNDLDPVTVTASLNTEKASQTGRNLIVISGEKFASLPVHSLDELLRYVPGVEMQARGPFGSQSDIVLRGGTFQQVLVIVDGIRVNDPNTGHFSANIPIAPAEIDRIEVLKGASSALYGSEAVGGVINIITKSFAAKKNVQKLQTAAQFTGGEYGLFAVNAGLFTSNEKNAFSAGVLSNNTNGQLQRGIRGFVNANTVSASYAHQFSEKWNFAIRSAYDNRKFAAQNFYTNYVSDTAQETIRTFWNQLQLSRTTSNNTLRIQAGYKNLKDSFSFNPETPTNLNTSELWQALAVDEERLSAKTTLTEGAQYINKKIISNDRGNHSQNQGAVFLLLNQQLGESFFAAPAVRLEWIENVGWNLVPQINLSYHLHHLQLRGSAGKTIRDADFTERYNNYNKSFVASGQRIGNPDLRVETSFSYEAGADYFLNSRLKLSATFFQRLQKNLIDYVNTPYSLMPRKQNLSPGGTYALALNIAEVNTTGAETDIQFNQPFAAGNNLSATLGFTYLSDKSTSGMPSLYLSSHAKYLTNFTVQYNKKRLAISVNGLYKMRPSQPTTNPVIAKVSTDYILFNTKAEFTILQNKLTAFAEADNLFNRRYTDLLGAAMPGRWFSGGIKLSFTK